MQTLPQKSCQQYLTLVTICAKSDTDLFLFLFTVLCVKPSLSPLSKLNCFKISSQHLTYKPVKFWFYKGTEKINSFNQHEHMNQYLLTQS